MAFSAKQSAPKTPSRRCLALWFPYLACEHALRTGAGPAPDAPPESFGPESFGPEPFALVARIGNALQLAAIDGVAAAAGLTVGTTLADAQARYPTLVTLPFDPDIDGQVLERLARAMRRFTPMVAIDAPAGLVLDISGCGHLFGDEAALIAEAVTLSGFTTRHGLASHAAAARALARYGNRDGDVRSLPVAALELSGDAHRALLRAGLRTIGDLAQRPMPVLAARFGKDAVMRLAQILGDVGSPIAPRRPVAPVRAQTRFAEPIARTDYALEAIEGLLTKLVQQMESARQGGRRFEAMLERSDGVRRQLTVETGLPVRDPAIVMRLFHEKIDSLNDPLDPGFGFDAVAVAIPHVEPLATRQIGLESDAANDDDRVEALIDRLGNRLGHTYVYRLHPCDTHIPESAQRPVPAGSKDKARWPDMANRAQRPLFLFDPPQPVEVIAEVPDGPPQRFRWRGKLRSVRLSEGPERIASEWWRRKSGHLPGHGGLTRDYYRIEDIEGRRFWLFRHGLFDEKPDPRWYIHGLFA